MLLGLERGLQRYIQDPVLLVAAPPDEVDALACLEDLVGEAVGQESRNHHVVESILLSPQPLVTHIRVRLDEELLEWVVDFSCQHPGLDHRENGSGYLFEDSADELLGGWAPVEDIGVDR